MIQRDKPDLSVQSHDARVVDFGTEVSQVTPRDMQLVHRGPHHGRRDTRVPSIWDSADITQPAKSNGSAVMGDGPTVGPGKANDYFIVDSLGWVQYREGDLKGAAETLRRAYGGRPDAEIGAHLGEVLWVMGDRGEANRIWQESLKSAPDNETLLKTIKRLRR